MSEKAAVKKVNEKTVLEKRRALGRGLESLLPLPHRAKTGPAGDPGPGPRALTGRGVGTDVAPPATVVDLQAREGREEGAPPPPEQSFDSITPKPARDEDPGLGGVPSDLATSDLDLLVGSRLGRARTPVAPLSGADVGRAGADGAAPTSGGTGQSPVPTRAIPTQAVPTPAIPARAAGAAVASSALTGGVASVTESAAGQGVVWLGIDLIQENPHQTRMNFSVGLEELAASIRAQGVLQPVMVRPGPEGRFTLILGERRLRASRMAGLETIPAMVKRVSEQQAAEMTLVENLQRQDLNCVDMASAFSNLSKQFGLTQEEIGARVGVKRETVANYMRLLSLPEGVLEALVGGRLTYSHARTLMQLADKVQIWSFAKKAIDEKMSVAKLEELVRGVTSRMGYSEAKKGGARWVDPNVKAAQRSLEEILGMRVRIRDRRGRGTILIEYATIDDFQRVVGMLGGKN